MFLFFNNDFMKKCLGGAMKEASEVFHFSCMKVGCDGTVKEHIDKDADKVTWECDSCDYVFNCEEEE